MSGSISGDVLGGLFGILLVKNFFNSVYKFGPEKVRVGEMVFRKFFINRLMSRVLFGMDFQKFMPHEVMYRDDRNRRTSLFHVASQQRMDELFTVEGWSAVTFEGEVGIKTCAGRVNVVRRVPDGRQFNQEGYIRECLEDSVLVKLADEEEVWLEKPKWDEDNGYVYAEVTESLSINYYDPIRIIINVDGSIQMILSRITFQYDTYKLIHE